MAVREKDIKRFSLLKEAIKLVGSGFHGEENEEGVKFCRECYEPDYHDHKEDCPMGRWIKEAKENVAFGV